MSTLPRYLYSVLFYLLLPAILLRLWWRGYKAPAYRLRWGERFGFFPALPTVGCLWIHAVSVGETRAALPLIHALRERYPQRLLLVTTTTPTGSQQLRTALGEHVHHVYAPYDTPDAVQRFLARTRPALGVIMETELWPNWFHYCARADIPLIVANARLSERSARGYVRLRWLLRPMLQTVRIAAQSTADGERFRALGVPPEQVQVTGNIKFDLHIPADLPARAKALRRSWGGQRPVWIAASTHAGEDEQVLEAFALLRRILPDLLLILVPRHPERFAAVAALCHQQGYRVVLRSETARSDSTDADIYLGDTMGELLLLFAAADIAFVGGSLVAVGGHNVMEPAALGLAVLFGPHMFNFREAAHLLSTAGGGFQIADSAELAQQTAALLRQAERLRQAGEHGRKVITDNRGALARLLDVIGQTLSCHEK